MAYYENLTTPKAVTVQALRQYTKLIIERFTLNLSSEVIESANSDACLLQFCQNQHSPVLNTVPAANVAEVAIAKGISTLVKFFGVATAQELVSQGKQADLLLGNNVLDHVPDINDFVAGMQIVLKSDGVITMEFPHLLQLMQQNQFDTIYHEHFSYLSLLTVSQIFTAHGLTLFDVEELPTHGGSLRIYAKHCDNDDLAISDHLTALQTKEKEAGLDQVQTYLEFSSRAIATKHKLLNFLIEIKHQGKTIVGYGAPAKGNTLLNYCAIRTDFLEYTCDRSPHKQGLFLPGTHIPIHAPDQIKVTKPDYVLILPWNLTDEIRGQLSYIREWGGKFVVPIPEVEVLE